MTATTAISIHFLVENAASIIDSFEICRLRQRASGEYLSHFFLMFNVVKNVFFFCLFGDTNRINIAFGCKIFLVLFK